MQPPSIAKATLLLEGLKPPWQNFPQALGHAVHLNTDSGASITSTRAAYTATRLSYNTGHGDFCFGRLIDRYQKYRGEFINLIDSSFGTPVAELNGFQRSDPFEFFKLQIDLRRWIYRLLLGPFFVYDPTSKASFIRIFFQKQDDSPFYEDDILPPGAWDRTLRQDTQTTDTEDEQGEEEDTEMTEKNRQIRKERHKHRITKHHERSSRYQLTVSPKKEGEHDWDARTDFLLIEWVRQASNTSPLFRKELGEVLWTNVHLWSNRGPSHIWQLLSILEERPAVHNSIKFLSVNLNFNDEMPWEESTDFAAWCAYISETLTLDDFYVAFRVIEEEIGALSLCEGRFAPLLGFRKLCVSKGFHVYWDIKTDGVSHSFNDPDYEDDDDVARDEYTRGLEAQWEPILRQTILPDTLRLSEQEKYLKSRQ